jgi:hypothetical protein
MPTGYTSDIYEGKDVDWKEFLMTCARAFGATISMREEKLSTPIPEEFEVDNYYQDKIKESLRQLKEYENMSLEEAEKLCNEEYEREEEYRLGQFVKSQKLREKLEIILDHILFWQPPSNDHAELKKFAIDQIDQTIRYDCVKEYYSKPSPKITTENWLLSKKASCISNINYYQEEYAKEVERVAGRNNWVKQLRNSLL